MNVLITLYTGVYNHGLFLNYGLITRIKLILVDAGVEISDGLFAITFYGCFVISPI